MLSNDLDGLRAKLRVIAELIRVGGATYWLALTAPTGVRGVPLGVIPVHFGVFIGAGAIAIRQIAIYASSP